MEAQEGCSPTKLKIEQQKQFRQYYGCTFCLSQKSIQMGAAAIKAYLLDTDAVLLDLAQKKRPPTPTQVSS